jgi:hypothetical protein
VKIDEVIYWVRSVGIDDVGWMRGRLAKRLRAEVAA